MDNHLLLTILVLPIIGTLILIFIRENRISIIKSVAAIICGLQLWIIIQLLTSFDKTVSYLQFAEHINWINLLNIDFIIGINGINLLYLALAGIVFFTTVFISWRIENQQKSFFVLFLLLNIGITGVLIAFDLFLFLMFYGLTLFAMFILVTLFSPQSANFQTGHFGVNALVSFCLVMIGTLIVNNQNPGFGFNLVTFAQNPGLPANVSNAGFILFLIGFLIIAPVFPFHSWLAAAVHETITPVSILLLALFSQIGIFGILHILFPLFPGHAVQSAILFAILGLIGALYYAFSVISISNFKKIVLYFAGYLNAFVLLGLSALLAIKFQTPDAAFTGLNGAIILSTASGLITLLLLLLPKAYQSVIKDDAINGNRWQLKFMILLILLAGLGLPGFLIFVGQYLCLSGAFYQISTRIISIFALSGLILIGVQFFRIIRAIIRPDNRFDFFVKTAEIQNEKIIIPMIIIILLLLGIFPESILKYLNQSIDNLMELLTILR